MFLPALFFCPGRLSRWHPSRVGASSTTLASSTSQLSLAAARRSALVCGVNCMSTICLPTYLGPARPPIATLRVGGSHNRLTDARSFSFGPTPGHPRPTSFSLCTQPYIDKAFQSLVHLLLCVTARAPPSLILKAGSVAFAPFWAFDFAGDNTFEQKLTNANSLGRRLSRYDRTEHLDSCLRLLPGCAS